MKPRSPTNASLINFQLEDFTIDHEQECICGPSSKIQSVRDRFNQPLRLLRFTHLSQENRKDYLEKLMSVPEFDHPTALKFLGGVYQGPILAGVLFQNFYQDLKSFIENRHKVSAPLNTIELLWVMRQLIAVLVIFQNNNYQHGNICLSNIVVSRNSQYHLVFRLGDFDLKKQTKYDAKDVDSNKSFVTDMYEMGIAICQLFTLDTRQHPRKFRDRLTREADSTTDKILASLLRLLLRMIDVDFSKRPEPKELQVALATLDNDYEHTFESSIQSESIMPAGSANRIIKLAQDDNAEAAYQLALLCFERGYQTHGVIRLKQAHLQKHARAGYLLGLKQLEGIGCKKSLKEAETSLRQSAELGEVGAQIALAKLFVAHGKISEAMYWYNQAHANSDAQAMLALLAEREHVEKVTVPTMAAMQKLAVDGSEIARFYVARTSLENKQANNWLQKAAHQIDLHMTARDGWFILVALLRYNFMHSCELKATDEVKPWLGEYNADMIDMVQRLLFFLRIPRHSNLLPIRFYANFKMDEIIHPLTVVVSSMRNGSMRDFLAKPENHDKAAAFILPWTFHLACALKALHDKNLVHQNISTNTILINDEHQPLLAGFDRLGYSNEHPEATKSNDIFAFGLVLFELMTEGKKPVEFVTQSLSSPNYDELIRNQLSSFVSKELSNVLLACLSPDLTKRPNAQQLVARLMVLMDHPPLPSKMSELDVDAEHYKTLRQVLEHNPMFASAFRRDALLAGESDASQPTNEVKPIVFATKDEKSTDREIKSVATFLSNSIADMDKLKISPSDAVRLAYYHFFALQKMKRDYKLVQNLLVKASKGDPSDLNTQLASAILSSSPDPLDHECLFNYVVPVEEYILPLKELKAMPYRVPGTTFKCSIKDTKGGNRVGLLINPSEKNIDELLSRCAPLHPNVIGPIGISVGSQINGIGLLFRTEDAKPFDRDLLADKTTAGVRLLQLLIGVAKGLAHLHQKGIVHGNVSQESMLVRKNFQGIIVTGLASGRRASAPESLAYNQFSQATDCFQFGELMMNLIIGDSWENNWSSDAPKVKAEIDIKTRMARYHASAINGFADVRARIPLWCRDGLIDVMMHYLQQNPHQRMTMSIDEVIKLLQEVQNSMFQACVENIKQAAKEQSVTEKKALYKALAEFLCAFDSKKTGEFLQKNPEIFENLPPHFEVFEQLHELGKAYHNDAKDSDIAKEVTILALNFLEPGSPSQNAAQFIALINGLKFFKNKHNLAKILSLSRTFHERFSNADFEKNDDLTKEKLSDLITSLFKVAPDSALLLTEFKIKMFNEKRPEEKKPVAQIDSSKKAEPSLELTQEKCKEYWDFLFKNEPIKESKEVVANTINSKNELFDYLSNKKIFTREKLETLLKRFNGKTQFIAVTDLAAAIQEQLSIANRTKAAQNAIAAASPYSKEMHHDKSKQEEQTKRSELLTLVSKCEASIDVFEKTDDATLINLAAIDEKIKDKIKYDQAKSQFEKIVNTRSDKGPIKAEIKTLKSQIQTKTMAELEELIAKFQKYAQQLEKIQNLPATVKSELGSKKKKKKKQKSKIKSKQANIGLPKEVKKPEEKASAAKVLLPSPSSLKNIANACSIATDSLFMPADDGKSAVDSDVILAEQSDLTSFNKLSAHKILLNESEPFAGPIKSKASAFPAPEFNSTIAQIEWERLCILLRSKLERSNSVSAEEYAFAFLRCLIRLFEALPSSQEIYAEVRNLLRHNDMLAVRENIIQFTQIILKAGTLEAFMLNARNIVITSELYRKLRIQVKEEKGLEKKRKETFDVDDSSQASIRQELIECAIRIFTPILQQHDGNVEKIKPGAIPMVTQFALESLFARCAERVDTDSCHKKLGIAADKLKMAKTKNDKMIIAQLEHEVARYQFIFHCRKIYRKTGHPPQECKHDHIIKAFKLLQEMNVKALSDALKREGSSVQKNSSMIKSPYQALSVFASRIQTAAEPTLAADELLADQSLIRDCYL